jgi:hypothetical protein
MQLGLSAMKNSAPKSIHKPMGFLGPKRKLAFAEEISYSACKGYQKPASSCSAPLNVNAARFTDGPLAKGVSEQEVCDVRVTQVSTPDSGVSVPTTLGQTDNLSFAQVEKLQDEAFEQMIDDMTFKVWKCGRCLSMTHFQKDCTNDIRCRACYSYGHIKKNCFKFLVQAKAQKWVPKKSGPLPKEELSGATTTVSASSDRINSLLPLEDVVLPSDSSTPNLPPPCTTPNLDSSSSMAVFEVDPTPWLPWGHQVIDGGPTRLPRTFYSPAQDPLPYHHDFCIAIVEPAPPPADEVFWIGQVLNLLLGPLNRNVLDNQPSLFGAGLF